MGKVLAVVSQWFKTLFFGIVAVVMAVLNTFMLLSIFNGDIVLAGMGFVFFSLATWVYLSAVFLVHFDKNATEQEKRKVSAIQVVIAWVGVVFSGIAELAMAVFEVVRMQTLITPPAWMPSIIMMLIIAAMAFHFVAGIAYFAAGTEYNKKLSDIFAHWEKVKTDRKREEAIASAEQQIHSESTDAAIQMTRNMLGYALPIIAEEKAREGAGQILQILQLDANPRIIAAMEEAIRVSRLAIQTQGAYAADKIGKNTVIDAEAKDAPAQVYQAMTSAPEAKPVRRMYRTPLKRKAQTEPEPEQQENFTSPPAG